MMVYVSWPSFNAPKGHSRGQVADLGISTAAGEPDARAADAGAVQAHLDRSRLMIHAVCCLWLCVNALRCACALAYDACRDAARLQRRMQTRACEATRTDIADVGQQALPRRALSTE
eukprot:6202592-Pleurochrysis_carterae.AAC.6